MLFRSWNRTFTQAEIEPVLDRLGITGTVMVEAADNDEDTELMLDVAAAHPRVAGIVVHLPLEDPARSATRLADLRARDLPFLQAHFGSAAAFYYRAARGQDDRPVQERQARKSISVEDTFFDDVTDRDRLIAEVDRIAEETGLDPGELLAEAEQILGRVG